jgi:hypothetical protein
MPSDAGRHAVPEILSRRGIDEGCRTSGNRPELRRNRAAVATAGKMPFDFRVRAHTELPVDVFGESFDNLIVRVPHSHLSRT